jgi:hypothetical protein
MSQDFDEHCQIVLFRIQDTLIARFYNNVKRIRGALPNNAYQCYRSACKIRSIMTIWYVESNLASQISDQNFVKITQSSYIMEAELAVVGDVAQI